MNGRVWIISFSVRGEEVVLLFDQETADIARILAPNPNLVDRLDTETMSPKKKGDET